MGTSTSRVMPAPVKTGFSLGYYRSDHRYRWSVAGRKSEAVISLGLPRATTNEHVFADNEP